METVYEFTKLELIKAFKKWNKEFEDNEDDFQKELDPVKQANVLIEYLKP